MSIERKEHTKVEVLKLSRMTKKQVSGNPVAERKSSHELVISWKHVTNDQYYT